MTDPTATRTFAGVKPESDVVLSFRRDILVNRGFAPLADQADLRVGGLQGSESVSARHPPLTPLPDAIPLKIQFPPSNSVGIVRDMRWIPVGPQLLTEFTIAVLIPAMPLLLFKFPLAELAPKFVEHLSAF